MRCEISCKTHKCLVSEVDWEVIAERTSTCCDVQHITQRTFVQSEPVNTSLTAYCPKTLGIGRMRLDNMICCACSTSADEVLSRVVAM